MGSKKEVFFTKKDLIQSIVLGSLCAVGVLWFLSENSSKKEDQVKSEKVNVVTNNDSKIFNLMPSLSGITTNNVEALLGKPKEIYKNKVYTYVDKYAQYDLLIEDKLQNIVVTMKDSVELKDIEDLLNLIISDYKREMIKDYKTESLKERTIVKINNIGEYSKIEVSTVQNSNVIEYIKIRY